MTTLRDLLKDLVLDTVNKVTVEDGYREIESADVDALVDEYIETIKERIVG